MHFEYSAAIPSMRFTQSSIPTPNPTPVDIDNNATDQRQNHLAKLTVLIFAMHGLP